MLTSLRSNLFYVLAALLLASVATTKAEAQDTSSRTPIAAVYNIDSTRHIGTFYESPNGALWAITEVGEPTLSIVTHLEETLDGESILYFDQYTLERSKRSPSEWVKIASGQFVLTSNTVTGGSIGYVVVTHNHQTGEAIPVRDLVVTNVQIEPIADAANAVEPAPGPTAPLKDWERQRDGGVSEGALMIASHQPSSGSS